MVSRSKLYTQLDALEPELEKDLIPHLEIAANGDNDLVFCVEQFNSSKELKYKTDKFTEKLINVGAQILALKKNWMTTPKVLLRNEFAGTVANGAI